MFFFFHNFTDAVIPPPIVLVEILGGFKEIGFQTSQAVSGPVVIGLHQVNNPPTLPWKSNCMPGLHNFQTFIFRAKGLGNGIVNVNSRSHTLHLGF